jgi:hypothetical protein
MQVNVLMDKDFGVRMNVTAIIFLNINDAKSALRKCDG